MKSERHGKPTSLIEVTHISSRGIRIFLDGRAIFLSYKNFPWFRGAPVEGIQNVKRPSPNHLYWPDLDIDLAVDSLENPERYPLMSRTRADFPDPS